MFISEIISLLALFYVGTRIVKAIKARMSKKVVGMSGTSVEENKRLTNRLLDGGQEDDATKLTPWVPRGSMMDNQSSKIRIRGGYTLLKQQITNIP